MSTHSAQLASILGHFSADPKTSPLRAALKARHAISLSHGGITVVVGERFGSKGAFLGATFSVVLRHRVTLGDIVFRRERAIDRFGKALRINREYEVGDPAFDQGVYIESDVPDATLARLLDATVREIVLRMTASGQLTVRLYGPPLQEQPQGQGAVLDATPLEVFLEERHCGDRTLVESIPAFVVELAQALNAAHERSIGLVHGAAPYGRGGIPSDPRVEIPLKTRTTRGVLAIALIAATWVVASVWDAPPTKGGLVWIVGVALGLVVYATLFGLFGLLLRGRSEGLRNVFLCLLFTLFAPFWIGNTLACALNAELATQPSIITLGSAQVRSGNKGATWIEVSTSERIFKLPSSSPLRHDLTYAPTPVRVELCEGALGGTFLVRVDRWRLP